MKGIPVKPLHQNPETGFIPLQNFNRSPPAVAERKHTARIGIKFEFQLECSFSPLIRTLKKLWRALGITSIRILYLNEIH